MLHLVPQCCAQSTGDLEQLSASAFYVVRVLNLTKNWSNTFKP